MQANRLHDADDEADWDEGENDAEPATIFCPRCGAETDDESIVCPVCQGPLRSGQALNRPFLVAIVLILIVLFLLPFLGWLF